MSRRNINEVLAAAQAALERLTPAEAAARVRDGWTLIDVRAEDLRARDGWIPGSVHAPLNVLEWRVDPASGSQEPALAGHEDRLILLCQEGYSSSLAAVRLRSLGFEDTTDVVGGFSAWRAAGLPVHAYGGPVPLGHHRHEQLAGGDGAGVDAGAVDGHVGPGQGAAHGGGDLGGLEPHGGYGATPVTPDRPDLPDTRAVQRLRRGTA